MIFSETKTNLLNSGLLVEGEVVSMKGSKITALLPYIPINSLCTIDSSPPSVAVVVAFTDDEAVLLLLTGGGSIAPGSRVHSAGLAAALTIYPETLWGVYDYAGMPLDRGRSLQDHTITLPLEAPPPTSLSRKKLSKQCQTGIKCIDALFPIAYGQRVALLAQPGVGKSTLLGAITKHADVDCTIIGLIGERGREVNEFIDECIGNLSERSAMLFVATSDALPMNRWYTALAATRAAEYFRQQGKNVLLCLDSLTRCARAIREYTLVLGELPVRHGFTPTVYELMPRLLERTGSTDRGSITALYTLLSEENGEDPLSAEIISLLDGHLFLSKQMAQRGIYPAVDPLRSISRLTSRLSSANQRIYIDQFIKFWSRLERDRDLLIMGSSEDAELLQAANKERDMITFLQQELNQKFTSHESLMALESSLR